MKLNSLEELTCDADLEGYILAERDNKKFLPNLKLLNEIPLTEKDSKKRQWQKMAVWLLNKLSLVARVYTVGSNREDQQAVWYVEDEVGSSVSHSDTPNVKVMTFSHSKENKHDDANRLNVSIMWPIKDIKEQEAFLRDFLQGFTEKEHFRSARLFSYFATPEDYYKTQLKLLR